MLSTGHYSLSVSLFATNAVLQNAAEYYYYSNTVYSAICTSALDLCTKEMTMETKDCTTACRPIGIFFTPVGFATYHEQ